MRTLYYVPVIHSGADLGSLSPELEQKSRVALGERVWQEHRRTVAAFWDAIEAFITGIDACGLKIYQDGLVVGGGEGWAVISEGARQGSRNYTLLLGLVKRGATLMPTEDINLLRQERQQIGNLLRKIPTGQAAVTTNRSQNSLMAARDAFIVRRIDATLCEGDTGIIVIGAYHRVDRGLPSGIKVILVKDAEKVREYHRRLVHRMYDTRWHDLAIYLAAPVTAGRA